MPSGQVPWHTVIISVSWLRRAWSARGGSGGPGASGPAKAFPLTSRTSPPKHTDAGLTCYNNVITGCPVSPGEVPVAAGRGALLAAIRGSATCGRSWSAPAGRGVYLRGARALMSDRLFRRLAVSCHLLLATGYRPSTSAFMGVLVLSVSRGRHFSVSPRGLGDRWLRAPTELGPSYHQCRA